MNVLFLTNNRTLGGTIRILQSWLLLGPSIGVHGSVVIPTGSDFAQWLESNRLPYTENPMPWPSWRAPWKVWQAMRLAVWARRRGVDIIHCNEHDVFPFAQLLRKFMKVPLVCHVRYRVSREFATWAFSGARRPDLLLWTSQQQKDDSADAMKGLVGDERQRIVPLGLDLTKFGRRTEDRDRMRRLWKVESGQIVIGQCCALRPRKRIEEFVDLVAEIAADDARVIGVLAGDAPPGDEPYREKVLQYIKDKHLGARFIWLGNIDNVEPFYQAIDVFVSTSEYETFGNSVCEAMACARPVVAYAAGSVKEVVGDAGWVVETADYSGLVAAARRCVSQDDLRVRFGDLAKQRVSERFNPAVTIAQLKDMYSTLVPEKL